LERNGKQVDYDQGEFSTDLFIDFVRQFIGEHRDEPFLVYYPMALVHCPFCPTPDSKAWDADSRGSKTYKGDPQYFADMVAYADQALGKILDCLDDQGVRKNTIVMFLGDNGTDTPIVTNTTYGRVIGAKGKTIDGGNHVPCIMQWPAGMQEPGRVCRDIIDFSDFLPSLCELAKIQPPARLDGESFAPQLKGHVGSARSCIFQWYHRDGIPEKAVEFSRNQRYKLYSTGEFFDVPKDRLEEHPLTQLTDNQRAIRAELQREIDRHRDVIPPQAR
jgi:arylsulfatase A